MCYAMLLSVVIFLFFKQKTAYVMRISDWSSDVCSSDLVAQSVAARAPGCNDGRPARIIDSWSGLRRPQVSSNPHLPIEEESMGPKRSEERRVGKECVSPCRSRWSPYH